MGRCCFCIYWLSVNGDFLSYDLGERRKEGDDVIKATNAGSTMQD